MLRLLGLGQLADPVLNQAAKDSFALLNGQEGATLRVPVLNSGHPQEIINWCRYILTQPMERAVELSKTAPPLDGPLHAWWRCCCRPGAAPGDVRGTA
jgi:hypothetical protein